MSILFADDREADRSDALTEAVVEAVAVAFNPALHPRGRGGKFRDILGKLHEMTPGHSRGFGTHLVTRGHGAEEHVFALQRGPDLVHRGSAEEVAGKLAPARAPAKPKPVQGSQRVTIHDRPGGSVWAGSRHERVKFGVGDSVILKDGREGTVRQQSFVSGDDEPTYYVHTTPPPLSQEMAEKHKAAFDAWNAGEAYLDNGGNYRLRAFNKSTGEIAPWNKEVKRDYPDNFAFHAAAKIAKGGWDSRAEHYTEQVRHSDLSYTPEEQASRREAIDKKLAKAQAQSGKKADPLKAFQAMRFPEVRTGHNVPDAWVVENGYGEYANPDKLRNYGTGTNRRYAPGNGDRVRVMPTHPTHGGRTGTVFESEGPLHGRGGNYLPGSSVNPMVRIDGERDPVPIHNNDLMAEESRPYVRLKPGVDTESMQYHYLVGHPPQTKFGPNTAGYEQWMYGMPKKYGGTGPVKAGDREAVLRRIASAVEAIEQGDRDRYELLLAEACEVKALLEAPFAAIHAARGVRAAGRFDPARHPRGRGGKWIDVLGKLRASPNGYHSLGLGVSVEHDGLMGFKVRDGRGRSLRFSDAETAVKHAVSLHENQRRRAFGPAFLSRRTPGGEFDVNSSRERGLAQIETERRADRPRVRSEDRAYSKAQALVDSGFAEDLADARAQLRDMGEIGSPRTPGERGEDLGIYRTEQLHMAAERLRKEGNLADAQHVQRELNARYRASAAGARPLGQRNVLRTPGGERGFQAPGVDPGYVLGLRSPQSDATIGGGGGGMRTKRAGGVTYRPVGLSTPLNHDAEYVAVGHPKDRDGDPRIAFRGTYDAADDYAQRNESPDNYERYEVGEVIPERQTPGGERDVHGNPEPGSPGYREWRASLERHSPSDIERAKQEIKRAVMGRFGGDLLGPALAGVEVSDEDAARYLGGATIEDLLPGRRTPGGERGGTDVAGVLMGLGPGTHEITVGGVPFTLYYDEQGATGDNGMPVRGDKTGDWELFRGHGGPVGLGPALARVHVSPHGSSGYGNAGAPRYAAEQVASAIHKEVLRSERRPFGGSRLTPGGERSGSRDPDFRFTPTHSLPDLEARLRGYGDSRSLSRAERVGREIGVRAGEQMKRERAPQTPGGEREAKFHEELPEGYTLRPKPKLARGAANKNWTHSQEIKWGGMERDLYVGGGFGWQRWGGGHQSSGVVRALLARGHIEVAEHPKKPLLFRLTPTGYQDAEGWMAEREMEGKPPEGAPTVFKRHVVPLVLSPDDAHLLSVLQDEYQANVEAMRRFEQYDREGEIFDREMWDRTKRRHVELERKMRDIVGPGRSMMTPPTPQPPQSPGGERGVTYRGAPAGSDRFTVHDGGGVEIGTVERKSRGRMGTYWEATHHASGETDRDASREKAWERVAPQPPQSPGGERAPSAETIRQAVLAYLRRQPPSEFTHSTELENMLLGRSDFRPGDFAEGHGPRTVIGKEIRKMRDEGLVEWRHIGYRLLRPPS